MTPYDNLPPEAFWKLAVAQKSMFDIESLWSPKFHVTPRSKVVTFGSCFAQHIGNALRQRGFCWLIAERPPKATSTELAREYNYDIFSARTANIYTASLLRQWVEWATERADAPSEVWIAEDRYFDPFRPRIEPNGFESVEEMTRSRQHTIRCFRDCIENADYFVFTLGLTESWFSANGYEYPMCPGTAGGAFDPNAHRFANQNFEKVRSNLAAAIDLMLKLNPKLKFILTVSPVPLTSTMSGRHVAVATMASKSILRAVADHISFNRENVDYFPSYEIINSPIFRGSFFEPNQRNVNPYGVSFVMESFFRGLTTKFGAHTTGQQPVHAPIKTSPEVCEEELLEAFGKC